MTDHSTWVDDTEPLRAALGIDGTPGDAQDVDHPFTPYEPGGFCGVCGLARGHNRHTTTEAPT